QTPESRELISAFTEGLVFRIDGYYMSVEAMGQIIGKGDLDAGLVIPRDFARKRVRHESADIQLIVDAVNANTATIAGGYAARIVRSEEHTSELQSRGHLVCRLLLEKKKE